MLDHPPTNTIEESENILEENNIPESDENNSIKSLPQKSIMAVYVTFGSKMSNLLNMNRDVHIITGFCGFPHKKIPFQYFYPFTINCYREPLETVMVYSNLVSTGIRLADSLETSLKESGIT